MQSIKDLKMILAHHNINKDQIIMFCKDANDQTLYISQTDLRSIVVINMRDQHCEEVDKFDEAI